MRAWLLVVLVLYYIVQTQQQDDDDDDLGVGKPLTQTFTYDGMDYMFFSERVTWDEASIICPSYKARLAVIKDSLLAKFLTSQWADTDMAHLFAMWIGGRKKSDKNWKWITGDEVVPNMKWPKWKRKEFREGIDCMALVRYHHQDAVVADLNCSLVRPFICEKSATLVSGDPIPTYWVSYKGVTYVLYYGHVNWYKAVAFCRVHGKRIAKIRDLSFGKVCKGAMTKSRPSLEMVWIGGHSTEGKWLWVVDGNEIATKKDLKTNYPPWLYEDQPYKGECLAFDKHIRQPGHFIRTQCNHKRSFVCEDLNSLTNDEFRSESLQFSCGPFTCVLVEIKSTWYKAKSYCKKHFKHDLVHLVNNVQSKAISDAMADHSNEIRHAWIGGHRQPDGNWTWVDNSTIPPSGPGSDAEHQFPAWCPLDVLNLSPDLDLCLNFDRTDYTEYAIYGLPCNETQAFVCVTDLKAKHVVGQNPERKNKKRSVQDRSRDYEGDIKEEFNERDEDNAKEEEEEEEEEEEAEEEGEEVEITEIASGHEKRENFTNMIKQDFATIQEDSMQQEEITKDTAEKEESIPQREETTEKEKHEPQETVEKEESITHREETTEKKKNEPQETVEKEESIPQREETIGKEKDEPQETVEKEESIPQREGTTEKKKHETQETAEKRENMSEQKEETGNGRDITEKKNYWKGG